eukprot:Colp12_sorted_trinity150504_noHs@3414
MGWAEVVVLSGALAVHLLGLTTVPVNASLTAFALLALYFAKPPVAKKHSKDGNPRERKISFMSEIMAKGFPAELDVPSFPIHGVIFFKKLPAFEDFKKAIKEKVLRYNRMRSVVKIDDFGEVHWQEVEVDLDHHLTQMNVNGKAELDSYFNSLLNLPLDTSQPMWDAHFVNNTAEGEESAVVMRFDHAIGDGISLVQVFMAIIHDAEGAPLKQPTFTRATRPPAPTLIKGVRRQIAKVITAVLSFIKCASLAASPDDSATAFRDTRRPWVYTKRRVALYSWINLERVKAVKNKYRATVNDVLSACLAGSLDRYMAWRKDPLHNSPKVQVRAMLPFAFPRRVDGQDPECLENKWCFVSLKLPVTANSARQRLVDCKTNLDKIKRSPEAFLQLGLNRLAHKILPYKTATQTARDIMLKHSMVFTNVPGPLNPVFLGGEQVTRVMMYVANTVPQFSIVSYNGELSFSIVVDDTVIKSPEKILEFFEAELEALEKGN